MYCLEKIYKCFFFLQVVSSNKVFGKSSKISMIQSYKSLPAGCHEQFFLFERSELDGK